MSTFLLNHPISHRSLMNVVLGALTLFYFLVAVTLGEIFRVLASVWPPHTSSRPRWVVAGIASAVIYPVSLIISVGWTGHDGLFLCLASVPFVAAWWLRTRGRLQARADEIGVPWVRPQVPRQRLLFGAADTKALRVMRLVIGIMAFIGFSITFTAFNKWTVGDPDAIDSVGPHHVTIHPRAYIVAECPASVRKALHLIGDADSHGHYYQRWSVVPKPGHLDEVFLDTDSGAVICP